MMTATDNALKRPPHIVVIGSSNIDLISYVPTLPQCGETLLGNSFDIGYGGKGANQAAICAKLGGDVTFLTKLGMDTFGDQMLSHFNSIGIDTTYVRRSNAAATGVAPIFVDSNGNNCIVVVPGTNFLLTADEIEKCRHLIKSADMLLCQNEIPLSTTLAALRIAYEEGVSSIFNVAPAPAEGCLPNGSFNFIDTFCCNETEAATMTGLHVGDGNIKEAEEAAKKMIEMGAKRVVLTLGADGCCIAQRLPAGFECAHLPGIVLPKENIVDTSGAGDCFTGSLGLLLASGWSLRKAAEEANRIAAISVQGKGTQSFDNDLLGAFSLYSN